MVFAIDEAGFEIRDCFLWLYTQNQAKAMSLHHFVDKMKIPKKEKEKLNKQFKNWKTPQVKSCFEPICMAQNPVEGTYLKNWLKHQVSLINTRLKQGLNKDMFVSNIVISEYMSQKIDRVFLVDKPKREEKGFFNKHKTVKPLSIFRHLIGLASRQGALY